MSNDENILNLWNIDFTKILKTSNINFEKNKLIKIHTWKCRKKLQKIIKYIIIQY